MSCSKYVIRPFMLHSGSFMIKDRDLAGYNLVLYSSSDPRRKANAALLMALYVVCGIRTPQSKMKVLNGPSSSYNTALLGRPSTQ